MIKRSAVWNYEQQGNHDTRHEGDKEIIDMKNTLSKPYGPFAHMYQPFFGSAEKYTGYDFGDQTAQNNPPPTLTFAQPLKWWSLDRPKRLRIIRRMRDQYLMDILRLKDKSIPCIRKSHHRRRKFKGLIGSHRSRSRDFTVNMNDQYAT